MSETTKPTKPAAEADRKHQDQDSVLVAGEETHEIEQDAPRPGTPRVDPRAKENEHGTLVAGEETHQIEDADEK